MSYNHTYSQIKEILKSSPKISKPIMLQVARLAIKETLGDRVEIDSIEWDSKFIEYVRGNYEVKILKETSTFSVNSDGDIRTRAAGCRYEKVDGNLLTNVGGKIKTQVDGGNVSCINGGAFEAMISAPDSNAYKINVSGNIKMDASGIVDIDGTEIYLN